MCAGAELLFLSGGVGRLSDRVVPGGCRVVKVQLFLLYNGLPDTPWGIAWALHMRFPVSVRMASYLCHRIFLFNTFIKA